MLIREDIIERNIRAFNNKPGEMINNHIFSPCLVLDLQVKFLQKENKLDEARPRILFLKEMLEGRMVDVHNNLRV